MISPEKKKIIEKASDFIYVKNIKKDGKLCFSIVYRDNESAWSLASNEKSWTKDKTLYPDEESTKEALINIIWQLANKQNTRRILNPLEFFRKIKITIDEVKEYFEYEQEISELRI